MNVNMKELKIMARERNGDYKTCSLEFEFKLENHEETENLYSKYGANSPHRFYISDNGEFFSNSDGSKTRSMPTINNMLDCLSGNSNGFNPYYDDGIYLIKFGTDGFRLHFTNERRNDVFATIPGYALKLRIYELMLKVHSDNSGNEDSYFAEYTFTSHELAQLKRKHSGKYSFVYSDESTRQALLNARDDTRVESQERLTNALQSLVRIAKNNSNGDVNTIHLSKDHQESENRPMSFYFYIVNPENKRIINGGIIAHKHESDDGKITFDYSMHT